MKNKLFLIACFFFTALISRPCMAQTGSSQFISKDSANKMISSYLASINYPANDSTLLSVSVSTQQIKDYINTAPDSITHFKLFLAHRLDYINSGHGNQPANNHSDALTIIIAAYNRLGNYVFYDDLQVLDYSSPCPPDCPPENAGEPLLTQ